MAGRDQQSRQSPQARASQPAVITPRSVAALVGGACVVALAVAAVESTGSAPAPGATRPNPVGLGLMALGLVVFGAGLALRLRWPSSIEPGGGRAMTLDESDVRAILERWHPDWESRHRARVAAAISYHRRRRGPND